MGEKVAMGQPIDCVVVISPRGKISRIWCMRDCVGCVPAGPLIAFI
jgi:hypothetical protein